MNYLVDTNIAGLIAQVNSKSSDPRVEIIKSKLESLPQGSKVFFSVITLGEVAYGLELVDNQNSVAIKEILDFLKSQMILEINSEIATENYSKVRARLFEKYGPRERKGKKKRVEEWMDLTTSKALGIQENDLWIVATALHYNLILVTADKMNRLSEISDVVINNWLNV